MDDARGDWSNTGALPRHLPFKPTLYKEFEKRLSPLTSRYPFLSYSIAEPTLAVNLESVIESIGFTCYPQNVQKPKIIVESLVTWLKKGRLILLHYAPNPMEHHLIDILKMVKKLAPNSSFASLIPIFMGSVSSKKQQDVFKVLGFFGIRYAMFLSGHVNAAERNIEELLNGLFEFSEMLKTDFEAQHKKITDTGYFDTEKIDAYKQEMSKAEKLMENGNYEEAIQFFTNAIELKADFDVLMKRGDAYYKSEEYIPALADYREANKLEQTKSDPYAKISACCFSIAKVAVQKEGKEKAKQWLSAGVKNLKSAIKINDEQQKDLAAHPEKAVRTPYASVVAAISDADLRGMGLEDEEKEIAALSLQVMDKTKGFDYLDPDIDLEERINKAMLLTRNRRYDEAEKIYRQIVLEDIENIGPAFNNFAVELRKNGQYGKAFEIYVELLKHDIPDRDIVARNLETAGMKYVAYLKNLNQVDKATEVAKTIIQHKAEMKAKV